MDDLEIIVGLLSQIQRGVTQTRNGDSTLIGKEYEKTLKKLESLKYVFQANEAKNVKSQAQLRADAKKFEDNLRKSLENAGQIPSEAALKAKKAADDYLQQLQKVNNENGAKLVNFEDRFEKTIEEWKKSLDKLAGKKVASVLSNGKSDKLDATGKSIKDFGDALSKLGGKNGALGKLGGLGKGISSFGTHLTKAAGPLGIMATGLQMAQKWWANSTELEAKRNDLNAADIKQQHQIKQRQIAGAQQIASNNASAAQASLSAMSSAASAAQSAMGAFAQEVVGIHAEQAVEGKKIGYDAYATSHEIASSLPFDIKNSVYQAAEAAIDIGSRAQTYGVNDKYAGKAIEIAAAKAANQVSGAYGQAAAAMSTAGAVASINNAAASEKMGRDVESLQVGQASTRAEAKYTMESGRREINFPVLGKLANVLYYDVKQRQKMSVQNYNRDVTTARNTTANQVTDLKAFVASTNAQLAGQAAQTNIQLATQARDMNLSIQKQQQDMKKNIEIAAAEAAAKIQKAWLKMTEKLNDAFLKHQHATTIMGREMGMTGEKLGKYAENMFSYQTEVAKWGKDMEWMQKAQGGYQESTGRNIEWSQKDYETTAAVGMVAGDDNVAQYVSGMEIFNHSVEDSNEKLYTMFKEVSRIGLNGKKYAKDLANNLKLAEKYNFKGGVDGLMRMSKWAQSMRFNVDSMDGMLDKVQTGGLEGVIKQSAELQVLGGNFAMGSDPLAMAYESYMDPEAYAKRMNKMVAGQGVFNSDTGEVSFGIASQQMMRQYADSTGQDYKDVLNQARAQVKLDQIDGDLNQNEDLSEDQKMLVANKAQFDKDTKQWVVNVNGENKAVSDLTKKDIEAITPSEDIQQDMLKELESLRSIQEKYNADQIKHMAKLEETDFPLLIGTNERILKAVGEEFEKNFETYVKESVNGLKQLEAAPQTFLQMMSAGNEDVDAKRLELMQKIDDLVGTLKGVDDSANKHIDGAMSQGVSAMGVSAPGIGMPALPDMGDEDFLKEDESKTFNWGLVGAGLATGAAVGTATDGFTMGTGTVIGAGVGALTGLAAATLEYCGVIDDAEAKMSEWSASISKWGSDTWNSITNVATDAWNTTKEYASIAWDGISSVGAKAWEVVGPYATQVWDGITEIATNAWNEITGVATDIWNGISTVATDVWDGVSSVATDVWDGVSEVAAKVWEAIGPLVTGVWNAISDVAIGVWNAVEDIALGIWNGISDIALGVWNGISDIALGVWNGVGDFVMGVFRSVGDVASGIWNGIKDTLSGVWGGVVELAKGAWNGIKEIARGAWDGIVSSVTGVFSGLKTILGGALDGVVALFTGDWGGILEAGQLMWDGVGQIAKGIWDGIGNFASGIWNGIGSIAKGWWNGLNSVVKGVLNGIGSVAKGIWNAVGDWAKGIWNGIGNIAKGIWNAIGDVAKGIWNAIGDVAKGVWNAISDVAKGIWNAIGDVAKGIWNAISDFAKGIWNTIGNVAGETWNRVGEIASSVWNGIGDFAQGIWNGIGNFASGVWDSIGNFAQGIWNGIGNFASGVWDGIKNVATSVWNTIADVGKSIWTGIKNAATSIWNGISDTASGVWNTVSESFTTMWGTVSTYTTNFFKRLANFPSKVLNYFIALLRKIDLPVIGAPFKNTQDVSLPYPEVGDGFISKDGKVTKIDDEDDILAGKIGGAFNEIGKHISKQERALPLPKEYDSFVRESLYHNGSSDGKIEIAPIQITFNGSIQLNGSNGMIDITQQIANDPNFIRSLSQMISSEMEKKFNGGKVSKMFG